MPSVYRRGALTVFRMRLAAAVQGVGGKPGRRDLIATAAEQKAEST
jgi:hypothetical protein